MFLKSEPRVFDYIIKKSFLIAKTNLMYFKSQTIGLVVRIVKW
jgi:hypothetical protein